MTVVSAIQKISLADSSRGAAVRAYYSGGILTTSKGSYELLAENADVKNALKFLRDGSVISVTGSVLKRPNEIDGYKVTNLKLVGAVQTIPGSVQKKDGKFYSVGSQVVELKPANSRVKQQLAVAASMKHSIVKGIIDQAGVAQVFHVSLPLRTLPAAAATV